MFGEKGYLLIKELARAEDNLPPYNSEIVNAVCNEIKTLIQQNNEDAEVIQNITAESVEPIGSSLHKTLKIRHAAIKRNTRCLITYHYTRLMCIKKMRWEFGSILPSEIKANLSSSEIDWFSNYSRMLAGYMRSIGREGVNLMVDLKPPKALYIEVRCLVDYGKLELADGSVLLLKKDGRHYLPRSECEELIRQGVFQHIV